MTDAERKLWLGLREQQLGFRRQAPIGRYIVDFVQHRSKLVVELDGGQHAEPAGLTSDAERTSWLNSRGYNVLRFWNSDVNDNLAGVLETIVRAAALQPSPVKGEGEQRKTPSPLTGEGWGGGAPPPQER